MPTLKYVDDNGRSQTIAGVLANVPLTGVVTNVTSGTKHQITVASTTGVYPGMPISCPYIPWGSFVLAVKSATELELCRSVFDLTTGVWSTSTANAEATAADTGMLAYAHGYHPACILAEVFAMGVWRNQFRTTDRGVGTSALGIQTGPGVADIITRTIGDPGTVSWTGYPGSISTRTTDEYAATPLKRHNGEIWGVRPIISTGGMLSHVPATPKSMVLYTAA